jgi:peptidyl-prolyl cis-trans isomerase C
MSISAASRRLLWLPLLVLGVLAWTGCGGDSTSDGEDEADGPPYAVEAPLQDSTLALVISSEYGTDTLTAGQYQQQMSFGLQRIPPNQRTPDRMRQVHSQVVRQSVSRHVMQGAAEAEGIQADSAQIESQLQRIQSRYESREAFLEELAANGITADSLRRYIADQLRQRQMQQRMQETAEQPTEQEVEAYSQENRRIGAQHILLRVEENAPQPVADSVRQVAEALVDSAQMEGVDFAALARRNSEGPSASQGGSLGMFSRDQMVEPFAEAAFALSDSGDVAPEPVRTRFGFHVIRLTNPGEPLNTARARQQMMQQRRQEAFNTELDRLMEKVTIRANPNVVDAGLYAEGGASSAASG